MKQISALIILVSFFCFNSYSQVQSAEVNYKIKLISNKSINSKEKLSGINKLIEKEVGYINMQLLINKNKSIFTEKETMEIDNKRQIIHKMARILAGMSSNYYCDIKEQIIIRGYEFDGVYYNITSQFKDHNWQLINETKIINNYICYKAVTTKTFKSRKGNVINLKVIAWYAPKIPIPLGPKNYAGLPGLIIELKEGKNRVYYAYKIDLNLKKSITINNPKKGKILTEKEYAKKTEGSFNKFINSSKN